MKFNKKSELLAVALFSVFGYSGSASADDLNVATPTIPTQSEDTFLVETDFTGYVGQNGGVYTNGYDNLTIKNSTFINNTVSVNGGVLINEGTINEGIINTVFEGNKSVYQKGTGNDSTDGQGGAIYNRGNILGAGIIHSTFTSNSATRFGGAITNWGNISFVKDSFLQGNTSEDFGGAIGNAGVIFGIDNVVFNENSAGLGGVIASKGKIQILKNSYFTGNSADMEGGAIYLFQEHEKSEFGEIDTIDNVIFENNTAKINGGAIYIDETKIGTIQNSTFTNNKANDGYGGAIVNDYGQINQISSSVFEGNSATKEGGAIKSAMTDDSALNIDNTIFKNNFVKSDKTIYYSLGDCPAGGALSLSDGNYVISNSEFRDNYVMAPNIIGRGGAIYVSGATLTLNDTSFYDNKIYSADYAITQDDETKDYSAGAGIDAENSTININAINRNVVFSNNKIFEKTQSYPEAIAFQNSILNLNAYNKNKIIFDDFVDDRGVIKTSKVNINKDIPSGVKAGEIKFNNLLLARDINIYDGVVKIAAPSKEYNFDSNLVAANLSVAGTLDIANDYIEDIALNLLDFSEQGKIVLDANLGTNSIDNFNIQKVSDGFGKINVTGINILNESVLSDGGTNHVTFITGADLSSKMILPTVFTSTNKYELSSSGNTSNTYIDFVKRANQGGLNNLTDYAPKTKENVFYSMTKDENLTKNLSTFNKNIDTVTVQGNNKKLSASNTNGFQVNSSQTFSLKDVANVSGFSGSNGSFLYNGGTAEIARAAFSNNSSSGNGGVISTSGTLDIIDSDFINNSANGQGGAIYAAPGATVSIYASERDVTFAGNTAAGVQNSIFMDDTSSLNLLPATDRKISIAGISGNGGGYSININKDQTNGGVVEFTDSVTNAIANGGINLYGGTIRVVNDSLLNLNDMTMHGGTLDMSNNFAGIMYLRSLNMVGNTNISIDADLANGIVDTVLPFAVTGAGKLNISNINVVTDTPNSRTSILFTGEDLGNSNLTPYITSSVSQAKGPIFLYDVVGVPDGNDYRLVFTNVLSDDSDAFNPNVFSGPVSAQLAGFANQLNLYDIGFGSLDTLSTLTKEQRQALILANKYAQADNSYENEYSDERANTYNGNIWFKPYATIEKVPLSDGPDVKNFAYGGLVGTDLGLYDLGSGWSAGASVFGGYTGSTQSYDDVDIWQNGGSVGVSGMLFKNDFFIGGTANVGGSGINANYSDGRDDFGMLTTGAALKTGYNFNLAKGKIIIQPHLATSYSYIKTSKFENPSGQQIDNEGLHAWQVAPGLKIVGNFKNNWQPYLGVDFMWNILDKARFSVEDVSLPDLSIDPYLQYGIGVQKKVGERFTGYAQVTARNIGRTGVSFALGGKWELGK